MRITPNNITKLMPWEIFVFGSNESGIHGAGAAKQALEFGAKKYKGIGMEGNTYAIPTKDRGIKTLPISRIKEHVNEFISVAKKYVETSRYKFYVTQIGCGLAGYTPEDITPLFKEAVSVNNIYLPESFWKILI